MSEMISSFYMRYPSFPPWEKGSLLPLLLPVEHGEHLGQVLLIEAGNIIGEAIGEFGRSRLEARCVDDDARMRDAGEAHDVFRIVPDDVEIADDALEQMPAGPAALAMLEGREIGARHADLTCHLLQRHLAL